MADARKRLVENYEDALFALLMDEFMQEEGQNIIADEDEDIPSGMEDRGLKLIRRGFRRQRLRRILRSGSMIAVRIAAVVFAVSFVFSVAFFSVEAFRVGVLNMILDFQETHTSIYFHQTNNDSSNNVISIEDIQKIIPEDYVLDQHDIFDEEEHVYFSNADGLRIRWNIYPIAISTSLDTEDADFVKEVKVDGYDGLLVEKNGRAQILWGDYDAQRVYYCVADFPSDQLLEMIEKLVSVEWQETHNESHSNVISIDDFQKIIPEDYVLEYQEVYENLTRAHFINEDGLRIEWGFLPITAGLSADTEDADFVKEVKVAGYDGLLVEKDGESEIIWADYVAQKVYYCIADFPSDQLVDMIWELAPVE